MRVPRPPIWLFVLIVVAVFVAKLLGVTSCPVPFHPCPIERMP